MTMDFVLKLRPAEAQQARALRKRLRLQDVKLYRCEAAGAGPPLGPVDPVTLAVDFGSEVDLHSPGGLDFAVTARVACQEQLTFHIQATFLVQYRCAPEDRPAKGEVDAFRKSHAVLAAWPYIREFVQNTAARMGFPAEPLPLLRLIQAGRS